MSKIKENNDQYDKSSIKIDGKSKSGNAVSTELTRLKAKKEANPETWSTENEIQLNKLKGGEKGELDKIDRSKRDLMDTGHGAKKGGNAFKDTHNKNQGTKPTEDPTKVKVEKIGSSGARSKISDNIKYDRVQTFESINEEIDSMRYLIEYMNNNKTNII